MQKPGHHNHKTMVYHAMGGMQKRNKYVAWAWESESCLLLEEELARVLCTASSSSMLYVCDQTQTCGAVTEAMAKYEQALAVDEGHVDTLNSVALLCASRSFLQFFLDSA
jgi:hypothetical protein